MVKKVKKQSQPKKKAIKIGRPKPSSPKTGVHPGNYGCGGKLK